MVILQRKENSTKMACHLSVLALDIGIWEKLKKIPIFSDECVGKKNIYYFRIFVGETEGTKIR